MKSSSDPRRRGRSLTVQLFAVLAIATVALSLAVTFVDAEQTRRRDVAELHDRELALGVLLAGRAAPLLERGDDLRLAVLAASAADLGGCRVFILDREGRVRLDTGLALGGQQLGILTADGALQRRVSDEAWEVLAPALGNSGFAGEVRLRYRPKTVAATGWSWGLFGLVFLQSLSLIALAGWIGHTWIQRLNETTRQVYRMARGERLEPAARDTGGALLDLEDALLRLGEVAERNARETEEGFLRMAKQVVHSLEQRGLIPAGHGERTRRYALLIADRLDLEPDPRRDLIEAALLHDIGKSCVRPSALTKRGELDELERESLRQHPQRGASLLSGLPSLRGVALAIRHQQEKYDGGGYPEGLRGVRIPLSSRILAIASAYDLLTGPGVHGAGMSWPDALDKLHEDRGEHFDPELLDLLEEEIRKDPTPKRPVDQVVISPAGAIPYKAGHDRSVEERIRLEDEQDAILAFGELELEVLNEDPDEEDRA